MSLMDRYGFLVRFQSNARHVRNMKQPVANDIGLSQNGISPALPFEPTRGFRNSRYVSGDIGIEMR